MHRRILLEALDEKDKERAMCLRRKLVAVFPEVTDDLDSEEAATGATMDALAGQFRDALKIERNAGKDFGMEEVEAPAVEHILDFDALEIWAGELENASRDVLSSANKQRAMMELVSFWKSSKRVQLF